MKVIERLGILGGTFNPPHIAHILLAERVRREFSLDSVLMIPVGAPPHKRSKKIMPGPLRLELLKIMCEDCPGLEISDIEVNRPGFTYTVDTLERLSQKYPHAEFYYIIGSDTLFVLDSWKDFPRVAAMTRFICILRAGDDPDNVRKKSRAIEEQYGAHIAFADLDLPGISSTDIRRRMAAGKSLSGLITPEAEELVLKYYDDITELPPEQRRSYIDMLRDTITDKRLAHTVRTEAAAISLAQRYGVNVCQAQTAALLHDMAKGAPVDELKADALASGISSDSIIMLCPKVLHGPVAAWRMKTALGIEDPDILNAVYYHTTARPGMSMLEKIIYMADLIEEGRDFKGVEDIRTLAYQNIDDALIEGIALSVEYVLEAGDIVVPDTIDAYNDLIRRNRIAVSEKSL